MPSPVLVIHGGGWAIPDEMAEAHVRGVRAAAAAGWAVLERGACALDAVEAAIAIMEDDETFDAGRGSFLNRDGRVQMDALLMDGATLRAGGVGCVERIRNPIRAARKVLEESPHVYLVAQGAERFAQEHGITLIENEELVIAREVERLRRVQKQASASAPASIPAISIEKREDAADSPAESRDTVGAVALDTNGNIASGTSTGGMVNKAPGRIGDSSLIGCGCYADNEAAAVSSTGWGEPIMKLVLGKWAVDRVRAGIAPQQAADEAMAYLKSRLNGHGGMILLDPSGRFGVAHSTPRMAWAVKTTRVELADIRRG